MERRDRNPPNVITPGGRHPAFPEPPDQGGRPRRDPDEAVPSGWVHVWARPRSGGEWVRLDGPEEGYHPRDEEGIRSAMELHRHETYTGDPADEHVYGVFPVGQEPEPAHDDRPSRGPSGHYLVDSHEPRRVVLLRDRGGATTICSPANEENLCRQYPGKYVRKRAGYVTKDCHPLTTNWGDYVQGLFR
jgi:hypothetical protein